MCISFPGRIIKFLEDGCVARIEIGGTEREVSLDLLDEKVELNDYLLCHAGFAIHRLDAEEAAASLKMLDELIADEVC